MKNICKFHARNNDPKTLKLSKTVTTRKPKLNKKTMSKRNASNWCSGKAGSGGGGSAIPTKIGGPWSTENIDRLFCYIRFNYIIYIHI